MSFILGLAQCRHPKNADVVSHVERWIVRAKDMSVDLLAFPESLMSRFEEEKSQFIREAQPLDGQFASAINNLAARYDIALIYTMNELNPQGNPFNTAVCVDRDGTVCGRYRKVHLFDSSPTLESDRMSAGSSPPSPLHTSFGTIGLGICYDLRFPEFSRRLAIAGCRLLVYPAAWVSGEEKTDQWLTLLAARAIENQCFAAGVCRCDTGYIGHSVIFGPAGTLLARGGRDECLVCASVDLSRTDSLRAAMPIYQHRRPDLY